MVEIIKVKETEEQKMENNQATADAVSENTTLPPAAEQLDPFQELKELLLRTQANFENYRKQTEKRIEEMKQVASKEIILQLLPLLDNFELVLNNIHKLNSKNIPAEFVKGIEIIYAQLNSILEENGVQPIITRDQKFDPYFHEALMKIDSDLPVNTIIEEFQKGFTLQGQVIRPAKVKISSGKKEEKNDPKNTDPNHTLKNNQNMKNNPQEEIKNGR